MDKSKGSSWNEPKIAGCRAYGAGLMVMDAVNDVHLHFKGIDWVPTTDDPGLIVAEVDQMIAILDGAIMRARRQIETIQGFEGDDYE